MKARTIYWANTSQSVHIQSDAYDALCLMIKCFGCLIKAPELILFDEISMHNDALK